jgi:hypothetical protein
MPLLSYPKIEGIKKVRRVAVGELTILEQDGKVAVDPQEQEAAHTKKGQDRAAHDPLFFHGAFM